jgi:hypothetical protein
MYSGTKAGPRCVALRVRANTSADETDGRSQDVQGYMCAGGGHLSSKVPSPPPAPAVVLLFAR